MEETSLSNPECSFGNSIKNNHYDDKQQNEVNNDFQEPTEKKARTNDESIHQPVQSLKYFKRIPIFIVDLHNEVLEFIYKALETQHLPLENNTLVHIDARPDLMISRNIEASETYDKTTVLTELSMDNWIMPGCYTGYFKRIVWLKNSWCKQIPSGKHRFKIGHRDNEIFVDCPLDYFIAEGNYCLGADLEQTRNIELDVITADSTDGSDSNTLTMEKDETYILDIDLSFFSTTNPFLEVHTEASCYDHLKSIFAFDKSTDDDKADDISERRLEQLETLEYVFGYLEEKRSLDGLDHPDKVKNISALPDHIMDKIRLLSESLHNYFDDKDIDWLVLYECGRAIDINGVLDHISTDEELETYYKQFKEFLLRLPKPPVIITMNLSVADGFCPSHQASGIQDRVLQILKDVFGEKLHDNPILHYDYHEWDVMEL